MAPLQPNDMEYYANTLLDYIRRRVGDKTFMTYGKKSMFASRALNRTCEHVIPLLMGVLRTKSPASIQTKRDEHQREYVILGEQTPPYLKSFIIAVYCAEAVRHMLRDASILDSYIAEKDGSETDASIAVRQLLSMRRSSDAFMQLLQGETVLHVDEIFYSRYRLPEYAFVRRAPPEEPLVKPLSPADLQFIHHAITRASARAPCVASSPIAFNGAFPAHVAEVIRSCIPDLESERVVRGAVVVLRRMTPVVETFIQWTYCYIGLRDAVLWEAPNVSRAVLDIYKTQRPDMYDTAADHSSVLRTWFCSISSVETMREIQVMYAARSVPLVQCVSVEPVVCMLSSISKEEFNAVAAFVVAARPIAADHNTFDAYVRYAEETENEFIQYAVRMGRDVYSNGSGITRFSALNHVYYLERAFDERTASMICEYLVDKKRMRHIVQNRTLYFAYASPAEEEFVFMLLYLTNAICVARALIEHMPEHVPADLVPMPSPLTADYLGRLTVDACRVLCTQQRDQLMWRQRPVQLLAAVPRSIAMLYVGLSDGWHENVDYKSIDLRDVGALMNKYMTPEMIWKIRRLARTGGGEAFSVSASSSWPLFVRAVNVACFVQCYYFIGLLRCHPWDRVQNAFHTLTGLNPEELLDRVLLRDTLEHDSKSFQHRLHRLVLEMKFDLFLTSKVSKDGTHKYDWGIHVNTWFILRYVVHRLNAAVCTTQSHKFFIG